jgi:flagellar M-ring protein FliF
MVSHSVEGLDPKNVTLVDTEGRILSSDAGDLPSSVSSQLDFRRSLESDLASKAEAMLTQVLGPGRAVVRLTADIDFTQTTRTENSIDPEATAKTSELIKTSTTTEAPQAAGPAGTSSNIGATATAALSPTKPVVSKTEEIDAQYENSRITNTVTEAAGQIRRLTIAAAVDLPEPNAAGSAASNTTAPGAITRQQVEGIIKQAVGFDTSRGDAIDVVVSRLTGLEDLIVEPPAGLSAWRQYEGLVRSASLGIAALVAFSLGLLTLRRLRPIGVPVGHAQDLSPDLAQRLAELSQRAQDDPQSVATALAAWLNTADDVAARQHKAAA